MLAKAFTEYSRALRATQAALVDPERWKSDEVLAAVLLLGMFEVSAFSFSDYIISTPFVLIRAWAIHEREQGRVILDTLGVVNQYSEHYGHAAW